MRLRLCLGQNMFDSTARGFQGHQPLNLCPMSPLTLGEGFPKRFFVDFKRLDEAIAYSCPKQDGNLQS